MKTRTFLILATSAFTLHIGVMTHMIIKREITLDRGQRFSFRSAPVDPHDAFRGKYLRLRIKGTGPFTNKVEFKRGQRVYVPLRVDHAGIASMLDPLAEPPSDKPFIKLKCGWSREDRVKSGVAQTNIMYYAQDKNGKYWRWHSATEVANHNLKFTKARTNTVDKFKYTGKYVTAVELPFDRYYMDEKLSPQAELAYQRRSRGGKQDAILNVRVRHGYALIESLEIDGAPIRDFVKRATSE